MLDSNHMTGGKDKQMNAFFCFAYTSNARTGIFPVIFECQPIRSRSCACRFHLIHILAVSMSAAMVDTHDTQNGNHCLWCAPNLEATSRAVPCSTVQMDWRMVCGKIPYKIHIELQPSKFSQHTISRGQKADFCVGRYYVAIDVEATHRSIER